MSGVNYDDVLAQIQDSGIRVDCLEVDTPRPVRCFVDSREGKPREKRGWYWLNLALLSDSDGSQSSYIVGSYGIWHGDDNGKQNVKINRDGKARQIDREQQAAINARRREQQRIIAAMRTAEIKKAAMRAAHAWRSFVPQGESDYLARKNVGAYGLRFSPAGNGTVAIPMCDPRGRVWGLQIIRGKNRSKSAMEKEYWPKGLSKTGHYHLIGATPRDKILIVEGYATGATLHEATGLPVAVAFDAGNLRPVAEVLHNAYQRAQIIIGADDDYRGTPNTGKARASEAALAVGGKWIAPIFSAERAMEGPKGPTDWNDLHQAEGLHAVRAQMDDALVKWGWENSDAQPERVAARSTGGGGTESMMPSRLTVDDAAARYWGTYGMGGKTLFDAVDRRLVHVDDVRNLLPRHGMDDMRAHPDWRVAREDQIGFDPTMSDSRIVCNLYAGWPTEAKKGECDATLGLLQYLCNGEGARGREIFQWVEKWLAYPIQHPGAKMQSALVIHGPQGTGKSIVLEAICKIYGEYGRILGQEALEDKYNSDWAEKKLFILADEVLARSDMFHVKNRLKSFITGDTIRINPKFVAAHNERNCMNIVFLSNERQPVALENDDRRHLIVWTPPKLDESVYSEVQSELENGGIEALHWHLKNVDLGDFKPWTKPPMTTAKEELIQLGLSSEERFMREWRDGEIETEDGQAYPFCPCLGSHLYVVYERWCKSNGEMRPRPSNHFLNFFGKQPGWTAARPEATWRDFNDHSVKKRKMVVPDERLVDERSSIAPAGSVQRGLMRSGVKTKAEWLTRGFFAFHRALDGML